MATEQQIPKLVAALVEHQRYFQTLSTDNAQWVIQHTADAIRLFIDAVENPPLSEIPKESYPTISVNYDMSLKEMIDASKYVQSDDKKRVAKFTIERTYETSKYEWKLFHFNAGHSPQSAGESIRRKGWEPAGIEHFFAVEANIPNDQQEFPIAILGSRAHVYDTSDEYVPVIIATITSRNVRCVHFFGLNDVFHTGYRYLAVRPVRK